MNKFTALVFSGVFVVSVHEVSAACGGGGWHQPASAPKATVAAGHETTVVRTEPVVNHSPTTVTNLPSTSLDSRFISISAQLSLSESQWNDVANAKDKVRNRIDKLENRKARAESKLAQCMGDCKDETRELRKAADALQSYDGRADFEKELKSILTSRQWDLYSSASISLTK